MCSLGGLVTLEVNVRVVLFSPFPKKTNKQKTTWSYISVTKFQDKFVSLRQVNSPNSWDKFQICCTDMYLIRFLLNFAVFCAFLWIPWGFCGFSWISWLHDRTKYQKLWLIYVIIHNSFQRCIHAVAVFKDNHLCRWLCNLYFS